MPGPLQTLRAAWTYIQLVRDPNQLDKVFDLISSAQREHPEVLEKLGRIPAVGEFLANPWSMECPDLDTLGRLPPGSLGRVFADHLRANDLDPAALFRAHPDDGMGWLNAHFEQTHDIWHVLTGFETDVPGELGLQCFYLAQIEGPPPMAILSAGLLHTTIKHPDDIAVTMEAVTRGWRIGRAAKPLFGVRWDQRWSKPLAAIRKEFGLPSDGGLEQVA